ncbi:MAG: hypothetical protein ACN4GR_04095 [Arenicellales bacterium]
MLEDSLQINRLSNQYLLAESATSVNTDKKRLDRMATEQLANILSQALAPLLTCKPGLVLLDKLECELTLDSTLSDQAIVDSWVAEITRILSRRLRDDTSQAMACFDQPSDLLAAFLIDLTKGQAWNSWIYRSFDGLKMLPLSTALRTALLDDSEAGLTVLLGMKKHEQLMIIRSLSEGESNRVLSTLARSDGDTELDPDIIARHLLTSIQPWSITLHGQGALSLWLFLQANSNLRMVCRTQELLIREMVRFKDKLNNNGLLGKTFSKDDSSIHKKYIHETEVIACISPPLRKQIINLLLQGQDNEDRAEIHRATGNDGEVKFTLNGGAIMLLRFVAELPIADLPGVDADDAACLRLMILAKAIGGDRFTQLFNDPVLRDLLEVPPAMTVTEAIYWAVSKQLSTWQKWMSIIGGWRRGQWNAKEDVQVLCNRYGIHRLVTEKVKGAWLYAVSVKNLSEMNQKVSPLSVLSLLPENRILRRSLADYSYLRVPLIAEKNENVDLALSVMAQGVLRDFSFCLSGFADSSLSFLYDNFLSFSARMEKVEQGYHVHLGRPSLNVILNMTSLQREQFSLPWHPSHSLRLFPES